MGIRQYTDEETSDLEHIYLNVTQDINQIAEGLGRDRRSIISKLVSMKIYINPPEKPRKRSVKLLTCQLQDLLGIRFSDIYFCRYTGQINIDAKENLSLIVDAIKRIREGKQFNTTV